ncbi:uncharacterized protein PFL1_00119 [Pseudozyma flocculosa PF-1]|uniref:N-acetyltransferase domain-containing protein n=1 Tax=Pseudozyma flocculosa TaxID=84751 RepID=A0A5C3EUK4_9BASI|nr:uncharacterized protein PFL1_00119 [Pseudozyma flocculosa PF-1]EPQ31920.1 hypothetical protein PFL1_00119 [Pseudozyma flocculosa PF-1]SPO35167.1 uncharacterized protein PSFLO_00638 [Pseudozyma flocculosa]
MPRRKIGADLKEALCKLYEAGDLSADTIEKHGIMSRATFFRNLKMWKAGDSLEQRHSTGRKTNADKRRQEEQQEVDRLQPSSLQQLRLTLLQEPANAAAGPSRLPLSDRSLGKKRDSGDGAHQPDATAHTAAAVDAATAGPDTSEPEPVTSADEADDVDDVDEAEDPGEEGRRHDVQHARDFCLRMVKQTYGADSAESARDDLDSLLDPDGNQYSARHRGAFWVVRQSDDPTGPIVATVGLRSFIWEPQLYQSLGERYATKSIDKIGHLDRLYVDPIWRRRGIGRWLTSVVELKASKFGFSSIYLHAAATPSTAVAFWQAMGYAGFGDIGGQAHFDKPIVPNVPPPLRERRKRPNTGSVGPSSSASTSSAGAAAVTAGARLKRPRLGSATRQSKDKASPSSPSSAAGAGKTGAARPSTSSRRSPAGHGSSAAARLSPHNSPGQAAGATTPKRRGVQAEASRTLAQSSASPTSPEQPAPLPQMAVPDASIDPAITSAPQLQTQTQVQPQPQSGSGPALAPAPMPASSAPFVSSRAAVSLPPPPRKITFHEAVPLARPGVPLVRAPSLAGAPAAALPQHEPPQQKR